MLAQDNVYLQDTVVGIRQLTEDEKIRMQCEARASNQFWERMRENYYQQEANKFKTEIADKEATINAMNTAIANKDAYIAELEAKLKQFNN